MQDLNIGDGAYHRDEPRLRTDFLNYEEMDAAEIPRIVYPELPEDVDATPIALVCVGATAAVQEVVNLG